MLFKRLLGLGMLTLDDSNVFVCLVFSFWFLVFFFFLFLLSWLIIRTPMFPIVPRLRKTRRLELHFKASLLWHGFHVNYSSTSLCTWFRPFKCPLDDFFFCRSIIILTPTSLPQSTRNWVPISIGWFFFFFSNTSGK